MRKPHSLPLPRVPRSRRDDFYEKAHPMCPKLPGVGVVLSIEDDTATVLINEEEISGAIPLGNMPAVDEIVEVESRCDLLVILPAAEDVGGGGVPPLVVVHHGTDPTVPRPAATWVLWLGTVEPANGLLYDCWEEANI